MLVLKRKVGERVMLGDSIEIQVLAVEGETVKLGFVAPRHIQILRKELYEGLLLENLQAGKPDPVQSSQVIGLLKSFNKRRSDKDEE
ncbi:carbon storage regulator CsrA [Cohnella cholangitidis]|uniref:Translational regulator CsrA n=1 Tax=Cohnella cholangitidis TaxID=2598458 RepID=A0A7G5BXJ5_9BACL|nr:carbon storage regulator CsrA [Cohnella cholangitidis]QMV41679.1 carbon storage regulator CsrA [Cohnella cholangitidis]